MAMNISNVIQLYTAALHYMYACVYSYTFIKAKGSNCSHAFAIVSSGRSNIIIILSSRDINVIII